MAETDEMRARAREIWEKYYPATVNIPAMMDDIAAFGTVAHAAGHAEGRAEVERLREALRPFADLAAKAENRRTGVGKYTLVEVVWIHNARAALAASPEPKLVECDQCGGTGFDTPGTGYGNVCSKCGGQRELPAEPEAGGERSG